MAVVRYERTERIVTITIDRPQVLNAINRQVSAELRDAFLRFRRDPEAWAAIVTGAGERAFSAGVDLKELAASGAEDGLHAFLDMEGYGRLETDRSGYWKPVIAAVNGHCLGIGCTVAMACDIRVAAENATFGFPEVKRGLPTIIGTILLTRALGLGRALEVLLTGDAFGAQDALRLGMVNRVVPAGQALAAATALAERICANAPLAVRATKELAVRSTEMPFEHAWRLGESLRYALSRTEDAREGPRAFAEKRAPAYRGR